MTLRPGLSFCAMLLTATAAAQWPAIDPAGLPGTRILAGGGKMPDAVYERFLALAGGADKARIVLIPTASGSADEAAERAKTLARWQQAHAGYRFEVLHTRDRATADREDFTAPLRSATAVWLGGGVQQNLADAYLGTRVERELQALLARGGVVGGTSAGTAIQTKVMIASGRDAPEMATGFDFVPGAISDQHFLARKRLPRLQQALALHPDHFGLGIDEGTAVEIGGRTIAVHGASKALLVLGATPMNEGRVVELAAGDRADLVSWQRAPRSRLGVLRHGDPLHAPRVDRGALVLVGGGRIPPAVMARFVALAGGAKAKVVLVPGAMPRGEGGDDGDEPFARLLRQAGVADVRTLPCRHPREATKEALAVLADATGVWFGGGRQWRLVDAFDGTDAIAAFHGVLARGGVIGGSSAGATIQGEFLVRGNPHGNAEMWCRGYDRGFGFLPGVAVDQHFVARNREADLRALIAAQPNYVGLGLDEGTAAVVQGALLEVVGDSTVAVFDARRGEASKLAANWLRAGDRWDLVAGERAK
ncbi:MAG: cyanophycinase [Phycisphaerales bacterium]|nr:cyanophycinase [Phycisphaerales bacterium]